MKKTYLINENQPSTITGNSIFEKSKQSQHTRTSKTGKVFTVGSGTKKKEISEEQFRKEVLGSEEDIAQVKRNLAKPKRSQMAESKKNEAHIEDIKMAVMSGHMEAIDEAISAGEEWKNLIDNVEYKNVKEVVDAYGYNFTDKEIDKIVDKVKTELQQYGEDKDNKKEQSLEERDKALIQSFNSTGSKEEIYQAIEDYARSSDDRKVLQLGANSPYSVSEYSKYALDYIDKDKLANDLFGELKQSAKVEEKKDSKVESLQLGIKSLGANLDSAIAGLKNQLNFLTEDRGSDMSERFLKKLEWDIAKTEAKLDGFLRAKELLNDGLKHLL